MSVQTREETLKLPSVAPTLAEWIDYRQIPVSAGGFSELFFDYVYEFTEVHKFYRYDFRNSHSYQTILEKLTGQPVDRATLTRVLTDQNTLFGSPQKTFEHIALLERPTTFAVVTGQQVGLFGGPLYTVFKTITTIKLAERLKTRFPECDFVPVFWVEGEDHDFAEMNNTAVFDTESKAARIEYLPGGQMPERNLGAIGELKFDESLEQTYAVLESYLQKSEFTDELLKKLRECYAPGKSFNEAFTAWMNYLFEDYGLVFISSNHPDLKRLLSPLFLKEIAEFPGTSQLVIDTSAELEGRYHAQVKPKSVNLFMFHKGGRYLIEPRENDFSLKGTRHFLQRDELLAIAQNSPELLSPNVILRPLAQDTLLPTAAYVAGPSEVAYHAQLGPVYDRFGITQPIVYPRASGSFIEERLERSMERYNLELAAFFDDTDRIIVTVLEQIAEVNVEEIFASTNRLVHDALNELKFGLKEIDQTLLGALEGMKSKIDGNLDVLKEKTFAAQKRRNDVAIRQIEKAANSLLPNGNLQEREINVIYYMNKYGPDLVKWLTAELDITGFKHQVISL